jgi:hypothetical protein
VTLDVGGFASECQEHRLQYIVRIGRITEDASRRAKDQRRVPAN